MNTLYFLIRFIHGNYHSKYKRLCVNMKICDSDCTPKSYTRVLCLLYKHHLLFPPFLDSPSFGVVSLFDDKNLPRGMGGALCNVRFLK